MVAPTFVGSYSSSYTTTSTPKTVSVTTQPGDLVVVYGGDAGATGNLTTPTGNGITFNLEQSVTSSASQSGAWIWTGVDMTGGTGWTLSVGRTSAVAWGFSCLVFRNSDGVGVSNKANSSTGTPSVSLTTISNNSAIVFFNADWAAISDTGRTWSTVNGVTPTSGNGLERDSRYQSGIWTAYGAYYDNAGSAGAKNPGMGGPSGQTWSAVTIEVLGTTAPVLRNTAEGQANGTALTSGNSGGGSGDAFDTVGGSGGTTTREFSNVQSMYGTQSYLITPGASSYFVLLWNSSPASSVALQCYVYLTAYPSTNYSFMTGYNSGGTGTLSISSTGAFLVNAVGSQVANSSAGAIQLNTWMRFDLLSEVGTTTSNGRIQAKLSVGSSLTPVYSYDSGYSVNTSTSSITSVRFGKNDTTPTIAPFYIDSIATQFGATDFIPQVTSSPVAWFIA